MNNEEFNNYVVDIDKWGNLVICTYWDKSVRCLSWEDAVNFLKEVWALPSEERRKHVYPDYLTSRFPNHSTTRHIRPS